MAISFSRPDPASSSAVSSANFSVTRRGFDQHEVREFLRQVSLELSRLQERERFLERELAAAEARKVIDVEGLDDDALRVLVGEEGARVLREAQAEALAARTKAEEEAVGIIAAAYSEASRVRESGEQAATAQLEAARSQGRDMVIEAREYREKVLADLAQRREAARTQIEHLLTNRDRLMQSFEVARLAAVDILAEMARALPAPPEPTVELPPEDEPETVVDAVVDAVVDTAPDAVVDTAPEAEPAPVDPEPAVEPVAAEPALAVVDDEHAEVVVLPEPDSSEHRDHGRPPARVVNLFPQAAVDEPVADAPRPARSKKSVDDLFAKLRAASAADVAKAVSEEERPAPASAPATPVAPPLDGPFAARAEALDSLTTTVGRHLKRVLADEQNAVLEALRSKAPVTRIDALVGDERAQIAGYWRAAAPELRAAAAAGAESMLDVSAVLADVDEAALDQVADRVAEDVVLPLRDRLERALTDADGDNEELSSFVRGFYREWKRRLDEVAVELALLAFGAGAYSVLTPGTPVRWVAEHEASCPDALANPPAGRVRSGEAFPSGHLHPPAGGTCRCLLVRVPE